MNANERPKIEADFEVIQVRTMANNAIRVIFEMPEYMIPQMAMFAECQRNGIYLHGEFTANSLTEFDDETKKGTTTGVAKANRRRIRER